MIPLFIVLLHSLPTNPGNSESARELRLIIEQMPPMI